MATEVDNELGDRHPPTVADTTDIDATGPGIL